MKTYIPKRGRLAINEFMAIRLRQNRREHIDRVCVCGLVYALHTQKKRSEIELNDRLLVHVSIIFRF